MMVFFRIFAINITIPQSCVPVLFKFRWRIPFKVIQLVADLEFDGHPNAIFQGILSKLISRYTLYVGNIPSQTNYIPYFGNAGRRR